jgi:hypothetical protein
VVVYGITSGAESDVKPIIDSTSNLVRRTFAFAVMAAVATTLGLTAGWTSASARLSGRVEHSEFLEPLSSEDEIGKIFDHTQLYKKMLASQSGAQKKFLVPAWLAGTWTRTDSTELTRVELPSGRQLKPGGTAAAKVTDQFGTYQDRLGLIWQTFEPAKALGSIDRGDSIDYHVVSDYQLLSLGMTSVLVEVQACHAVVDKKTNKVISAYQDEELNTYTSLTGDTAKTDSSVKMFDVRGKAIFLTRALSSEQKVAPFSGQLQDQTETK